MSACDAFTEHVWKPGECKNCFRPKSLHRQTGVNTGKADQHQKQRKVSASDTVGSRPSHVNNYHNVSSAGQTGTSSHFRPPVAKKPTIAVKPTMALCTTALELQGSHGFEHPNSRSSAFTVWNQNLVNCKRPRGTNNNVLLDREEEHKECSFQTCQSPGSSSSNNNNGLTEVLKEIVCLGSGPGSSSGSSSLDVFLGRINSCYKRSLERGLLASSCLTMGRNSDVGMNEGDKKKVSVSGSTEVISKEGGRFCYSDFSSEGEEDDEDESEEEKGAEHESWDESDEELLAMNIRMRGQPRFACFRAATLSPVRFSTERKWSTVPLRNVSLQRILAVDYDDSYDEILNGYPSEGANGGMLLNSPHSTQDSLFFSNSESGTSPETSSSLPEGSLPTPTSPGNLSNNFPAFGTAINLQTHHTSNNDNEQLNLGTKPAKQTVVDQHKTVLAVRLEEQRIGQHTDGGVLKNCLPPQALPDQIVTISFNPTEEQANPYRVVSLEQPTMCKPYTVVDVSGSMGEKSNCGKQNLASKALTSPTSLTLNSTPLSPQSPPLNSPTMVPKQVSSTDGNSSPNKAKNISYQEVWTSSSSPQQNMSKIKSCRDINTVDYLGGLTVPSRSSAHKSAPTSPTMCTSSSNKTVPIKSSNLSEIKFNSYNNAGMPPFPIIIRDEPAYAGGTKNAVKVPILINPSAYDNLAVYKSFLGLRGELPLKKDGRNRVSSHAYEEIGPSESNPSTPSFQSIAKPENVDTEKKEEIKDQTSPSIQTAAGLETSAGIVFENPAACSALVSELVQKTNTVPLSVKEGVVQANTGTVHREKASTVLFQTVTTIQPPQSPPESPIKENNACHIGEICELLTNASIETVERPKTSHTLVDGIFGKRKQVSTPGSSLVSAKVDPAAPFPPPRSTSSPYHANKLLQRHFGNWSKTGVNGDGPSSPSAGTSTSGIGEGRQTVSETPKAKRWISFKSFFHRRKNEEECQKKDKLEPEKGKLVGLDGTIIHMLPPPPVQQHNWFTEAKTDDPNQKPTIIFTCKPRLNHEGDLPKNDVLLQEDRAVNEKQTSEGLKHKADDQPGQGHPSKNVVSQTTEQGSINEISTMIESCEAHKKASMKPLKNGKVVTSSTASEGTVSVNEEEDDVESTASGTCQVTYSNLGQSRANMIPLKQPRNAKASDDATVKFELSDSSTTSTPLTVPKKMTDRNKPESLSKGKGSRSLKIKKPTKSKGDNHNIANPLYDLDTGWETASQSSSLSSEAQLLDANSGDSLEKMTGGRKRPRNSLSIFASTNIEGKAKKDFCSLQSLPAVNVSEQGEAYKPQRHVLCKKWMDGWMDIENWEEVMSHIRGLHSNTLQMLANKCKDIYMAGKKRLRRFGTECWSDFHLTTGTPCCESGDAIYYTASYAKDPLVNYAVKICKSKVKETQQQFFHSLAVRQSLPEHFNIQQDCGHFFADVPVRLLPWEMASTPEEDGEKVNTLPEAFIAIADSSAPSSALTTQKLKQVSTTGTLGKLRSCVVVITQEVPYQTLSDFVKEGISYHIKNPDLYERQICLLLLQLCSGLEHMKAYHVTHSDLRLENLLLVRCQPNKPMDYSDAGSNLVCPGRLIISNFSQAKHKSELMNPDVLENQSRLAPEIISATQYKKCDEFQTGILIYEMLHRPNPFEELPELKEREYTPSDLPRIPQRSLYSQGLDQLASLLLNANPSERIQISEARAFLQCLLWGPRDDLFQTLRVNQDVKHREIILQNWLDVKRTLMIIKFAEYSLSDGIAVSLEDWLCSQYLAFTNSELLASVVAIVLRQHEHL
ncbi:inactive tyrosine-protein kinase PEAK1 [Erpetoichthys calabaricus]|uniref:inactive tyrosine-protein kinase PEAK1 n=1 Tax=Erpetoichthys calabaricus TaxID=27687 RepID=UPI0022349F00|nr:inactive tyrosine-protein kinase PEAK1 [Erpetoichthys calabaricus]XP_051776267.1 inactive tyrosine-protein kinase PEAK1 [Erpetoichthys calabaricus]